MFEQNTVLYNKTNQIFYIFCSFRPQLELITEGPEPEVVSLESEVNVDSIEDVRSHQRTWACQRSQGEPTAWQARLQTQQTS